MNKEKARLKPDLVKEQVFKKQEGESVTKEESGRMELFRLFQLADGYVEEAGSQETKATDREILKLKQELVGPSSDEQKMIEADFERWEQLTSDSKKLLEDLKKKIRRAVAIGILMAALSLPAFASESQSEEIIPQQKKELRLEKRKLEIRDLQPGMVVDRTELKECLRNISKSEANEWRLTIAWEKGKQLGHLLEVNEGGPASSFSDANLALSSFIEGKKIEDIHTHPVATQIEEIKKTSNVDYDSAKFAAPPSFGDVSALYFSRDYCKKNGLGMTALLNKKLFVEESSGQWEYGIADEKNMRMERFSDFVNSWRDKRNEKGRKMMISQEELQVINSFSDEINKNKDIKNEFTQTLILFFQAKAKEVSDQRIKEQCLSIANKASQISNEACKEAFSESGVTQEDLKLMIKIERLTQEIYGFWNAKEASPKDKAQKIKKLKECYKELGVFLKYTENKEK
jgi:hypothetical protein